MFARCVLRVFVSSAWGDRIPAVERLLDETEVLNWWNVGARDDGRGAVADDDITGAHVLLVPAMMPPSAAEIALAEVGRAVAARIRIVALAGPPLDPHERRWNNEISERWRAAGVPVAPWDAAAIADLLMSIGVSERAGLHSERRPGPEQGRLEQAR